MKHEATISAIVIRLHIRDGAESLFLSWQAQMAAAAASAPGFSSIEFIPVLGLRSEWQMALQFRDAPSLAQWRGSQDRHRLHEEVHCLLKGAGGLDEAAAPDLHAQSSVTEVITTHVSSGMTTAYLDWLAKIQLAQAQFPGYRGAYLQSPSQGQAFWTTLIRFATPMQLDAWMTSRERRRLIREADSLVEAWSSRRLAAPFAGWFLAEETGGAPPNWKQSMAVLLMLFPMVMLELHFLAPLTRGLNAALATFWVMQSVSGCLPGQLCPSLIASSIGGCGLHPRGCCGSHSSVQPSCLAFMDWRSWRSVGCSSPPPTVNFILASL